MVRPMLDCGVISKEAGQWEGVATTDNQMLGLTINLAVANSGDILVPDTDSYPSIDMTGYTDLFIAIKCSNSGNYQIKAVQGPDTVGRWGLYPVNSTANLRGAVRQTDLNNLLVDTADSLTADKWDIFYIQNILGGQKNLQFKIINNSGGNSDIEFAFLRRVV